ncbi:fungal specific transcription factor domain-containing protein [Candidatus Bathyarchaeota archaeon]|nr:fungal specific transcription factor domain-containing protein [Candidatus Bathyarchaeota archaeon]
MYENHDSFPFIVGARSSSVTHLHPSPIHIFQLWQVYINNINPLLRITHVPTAQGRVIEASANLERTPMGLEALMFAVYLMALISIDDAEVQVMFGEPRMQVLGRFHLAAQQALINAGLMRTNDITVLQAYILYLVCRLPL